MRGNGTRASGNGRARPDPDWARHMEAVARHLLGPPNPNLSSKTELRYGNRGSLSVDLTKGTFYDHEGGEGGGVLDLIARETGKANGEAVAWMRDELRIEIELTEPASKLRDRPSPPASLLPSRTTELSHSI